MASDDLMRFSRVAMIHDENGFLIVLDQLLAERAPVALLATCLLTYRGLYAGHAGAGSASAHGSGATARQDAAVGGTGMHIAWRREMNRAPARRNDVLHL